MGVSSLLCLRHSLRTARYGTACTAPPSPSCRPAAGGCLPHVLLLELGEALQVALLIRDLVRGHLVEASGAVHAEPQEVKLLYRSLHTPHPSSLDSALLCQVLQLQLGGRSRELLQQ